MQASQRTAFSGPTLIRLLTRLTDVDVPESRLSLSDRLSQWLGWTDAIALSTALTANPPAAPGARSGAHAEGDECARVRASLAKAIAGDSAFSVKRRNDAQETSVDYAFFRQRCLSLQQTMETSTGTVRARLRAMLATRSPAMTRLAMVDAVMEQSLSARERSLFATVPVLLGGHFERLRRAEQATLAANDAQHDTPGAWLDVFRKDLQSVMLAELDIRFQPVEGLLAALQAR
ncbi:hypothetical protein AWB65_02365 [Caballeronia humi]|uniref:DUF3348 domain-containing protein n=1 Tax=Caballeronia humi TaxID=326474 RepID=A0A158GSE8_9BURK|nr:hypothetical protein AWB65_02365 [Caballeronia humi]